VVNDLALTELSADQRRRVEPLSPHAATVTFQPTTGGLRKGTVKFTLKGASSKSVSVSGNAATVTLNPTLLILYFGESGTVTVTNPLATPTSVQSIKLFGEFHQTNNCGTLAPGASCTITVTWNYTGFVRSPGNS